MKLKFIFFAPFLFINCFLSCLLLENKLAKDNALLNPCPELGRIQNQLEIKAASFNGYTYIRLANEEMIYIETKFVDSVDSIDNQATLSKYLDYYKEICTRDRPLFYEDISFIKKK